jgi:hypothetical protein
VIFISGLEKFLEDGQKLVSVKGAVLFLDGLVELPKRNNPGQLIPT